MPTTVTLDRKITLVQATALNMIDMVGIGPFVVLPLVIQMIGGPHFIFAWLAGAFLSVVDGMIWAELGAAYPKAGGSYNFLKESYGKKWGRMMSFLYVWQTMIQAPLVAASGAIGFAETSTYLYNFSPLQQKFISGSLIILLTFLLYRKIQTIGKIGVVMWIAVLATLAWIIFGGITHHTISNDWIPSQENFSFSLFFVALGQASVKTVYSYLGYYNVCHLGGEIKSPEKNIPRSIFISIIGIAVLYLAMNVSVVSVIPWQEAQNSSFIVSTFIEKIYGSKAAAMATVLVLIVAFSSLFAVLLGYSRIPYAAAADGKVIGSLPLEVAGLMSSLPANELINKLSVLHKDVRSLLGLELYCPFVAISFHSSSGIPKIKVTDKGLVDTIEGKIIPIII
jgi:fructoselysine transporter